MSRIIVGPFNRVEGDLQIGLDIQQGTIARAEVNAHMFRGFEQILHGKYPDDAMIIVPRICGICSVSQSIAAAKALADLANCEVPNNGGLLANIIHAVENVADHITHFYLFFMPDFAHADYHQYSWYENVHSRFQAIKGKAAAQVLPARAEFMQLMGLFAGKWPHSLTIQPGGVTRNPDRSELLRAMAILNSFRHFLQKTLYADHLDTIIQIQTEAELLQWAESAHGDLKTFIHIAKELSLHEFGCSHGQLMSYGAYGFSSEPLFRSGCWKDDGLIELDTGLITEDISHSWMEGGHDAVNPQHGTTLPQADKTGAYSWCKAPRLAGEVVEVGALARQVIDGHPLLVQLYQLYGACVYTRIIARMLEVARVIQAMEEWLNAFKPSESIITNVSLPEEGSAIGLTEAARGSLGHWIQVQNGRLINYQIIAPTTWNFSPRDAAGNPGALEMALQGTPVKEGDKKPVMVQHIVRSFDPCMVCTVH